MHSAYGNTVNQLFNKWSGDDGGDKRFIEAFSF